MNKRRKGQHKQGEGGERGRGSGSKRISQIRRVANTHTHAQLLLHPPGAFTARLHWERSASSATARATLPTPRLPSLPALVHPARMLHCTRAAGHRILLNGRKLFKFSLRFSTRCDSPRCAFKSHPSSSHTVPQRASFIFIT